jgi:excinuclease ABC subunit C
MPVLINKIKVPRQPGCYLMKDKTGEIIYIGKAKNLFKRVNSYFLNGNKEPKTENLVKEINKIDFIITRNEVEALVLEARLIRQHQPKYNLMLKENQPFMYIKITDEATPRILSVRKIDDNGKYFGPFVGGKARKYLVLNLARLFGLKTNKLNSRSSQELYQLLNQEAKKEDYKDKLKMAQLFLEGKREDLVKSLEKKMKVAAIEKNYELAKIYLEQIREIKRYASKQLVSLPKAYDQDIINIASSKDKYLIVIFNLDKGVLSTKKNYSYLQNNLKIEEALASFVSQYYLLRPIPKEIIIPFYLPDQEIIVSYLSQQKRSSVKITVPKKGDKKELLDLVAKNIITKLDSDPLLDLQLILKLPFYPKEIDCFDISNISGQNAVASCVHFSEGRANKDWYRHFKIKEVSGIDDFAMIKEAVQRRYSHPEWLKPDLILIDGGLGQLHMAKEALVELGLSFPLISLAKKREEIYILGQSRAIILDKKDESLNILRRLRDEAHRFAINYHRLLRAKRG